VTSMVSDAWKDKLNPTAIDICCGGLTVRLARSEKDLQAVQALRAARFRAIQAASDLDRFDPLFAHLLVYRSGDETPLATARFRLLSGATDIASSYTAQFYDLDALARAKLRLMEIGRICLRAGHEHEADLPRALLAGLTRAAQVLAADMLIGCASFQGAQPHNHIDALRYLHAHHLGPVALRPRKKGGTLYDLHQAAETTARPQDLRHVPALLRLYLGLGGWVSDHAVCDLDLNTLHVFTAVDVRAIPSARLRALTLLAQG
jgi:L-ornithine Nalpha-acyltransferase